MDDQQLQEQEFNLDDIIREFGGEPAPEEPAEQKEAEVPAEEETVQEPEQSAPVTGDTIRLEKIPVAQGTVRNAKPITEEEPEIPAAPQETTEPYSDQWEPEYEQPIAEYVPPQPITFRPHSRLRELKRQLVSGPEKLYYALSEKGLVKLQLAIFCSLLLAVVSAVTAVMFAMGYAPERLRLMVFGQFWVMLVSALLGSFQLIQGGADLFRGRFTMNTMLLFTFLLCCVDGVLCLSQLRVPCCAAFSLQVAMCLWSEYHRRNTKLGQLDTMRKAIRLDSITAVPEYYEDKKGFVRSEGQVAQFMDTYETSPKLEKTLSVYTLVSLCISVAAGVLAGVLHGVSAGIQVASVTALAAMPASMFITLTRPMAVLEKRLHRLGAVLCGWQGVEGLAGKAVFPITPEDAFPGGTVQLNGVKFFGKLPPDTVIAYAAALMEADGNSLQPIFTHLLDSRNGRHYTAENLQVYQGGIGAEVDGKQVLAGSLSFLKDMGAELPEGIRVTQAVCLAVDAELCGLFALNYEKDRSAAAGLSTLTGHRKLGVVMTRRNFMLSAEFLKSFFGANPKRIAFPDLEQLEQMQEKQPSAEAPALAMVTAEGLAPFAYAVTGARALNRAAKFGVAVHMAGGILGMVMMLVLAYLGATELLTPVNMFLYELVWLVPGLLLSEWTRTI